jgi:hypothetical protein
VILVAHVSVKVVRFPEGTGAVQTRIGLPRDEGLPALHDGAQGVPLQRFDHDVDMVRHDAPRKQAIALSVEVQQGLLGQRCDFGIAQPARTQSRVEFLIGLQHCVRHRAERLDPVAR